MHTQAAAALDLLQLENTGVPIYVQLREQFLRAMGQGLLKAGDQMPTMRQVAVHLRVDLNTVRHAYDELERLGALVLVRGRGSFVAEPPPAPAPAQLETQTDNLARQTLAAARAQGIDPAALCDRIAALAAAKEDNR
jgi:GntR family transcriptional regulator